MLFERELRRRGEDRTTPDSRPPRRPLTELGVRCILGDSVCPLPRRARARRAERGGGGVRVSLSHATAAALQTALWAVGAEEASGGSGGGSSSVELGWCERLEGACELRRVEEGAQRASEEEEARRPSRRPAAGRRSPGRLKDVDAEPRPSFTSIPRQFLALSPTRTTTTHHAPVPRRGQDGLARLARGAPSR